MLFRSHEDGCVIPDPEELSRLIPEFMGDPLAGAACDLLSTVQRFQIEPGRMQVQHRWKHASFLAQAYRLGVPVTVHPGIGYDIVSCHPMFHGAAIGQRYGATWKRVEAFRLALHQSQRPLPFPTPANSFPDNDAGRLDIANLLAMPLPDPADRKSTRLNSSH